MKLRVPMLVIAFVSSLLPRCGGVPCLATEFPCTAEAVPFRAECGFATFTSTCIPSATCTSTWCSIPLTRAQTCDVSMELGDGTSHTAHLVITEPPAPDAACPSGCPPIAHLDLTVDGLDVSSDIIDFSSATCQATDAGLDGSTDST
jgi:hypothetical protein